jgi:glycerol-3-phosphate dehydrogenase
MLHCDYCSASIFGVCAMNYVVEDILNTYQSMRPLDAERAADSRQRISRYIENLASAGQRDDEQLTIYGLAYLAELLEGPDPRFTGC